MANWEDLRIIDAVEKIEKEEIVLPVIQRELVWDEEKIELLFDTVLRGEENRGHISPLDTFRLICIIVS